MGDKEVGAEDDDDDDAQETKFAGKKKPKGKKGGSNSVFSSSNFGLLGEDEEEDDNDRKDNDEDDEEQEVPVEFSGKKKPSKRRKVAALFLLLLSCLMERKRGMTKTRVLKRKKRILELLLQVGDDLAEVGGNDQEEDILEVKFSGKKKSSKKKNVSAAAAPEVESIDTTTDFAKPDDRTEDSKTTKTSEDVADTSKNKKKKKKGGKAGQEDEDLDKILAELGGAPTVSNVAAPVVPTPVEKVQNQPEPEEAAGDKEAEEEGPVESVASKKKKKKKEKEKEKKAAAAAPAVEEKQEEIKSETNKAAAGKKVPKHVREMQEKLARLKEAEEKKKREEEEKLRKEEEERRRQEELERIAEEKKRLKKEREKEKLLKKSKRGSFSQGSRRKKLVGAPAKRPLYQKKKSKPQPQSNGAATSDNVESTSSKEIQQEIASELDSVEAKNVEEVESSSAQDKTEVIDSVEENGVNEEQEEEEEDDDEEWDAKSWDDADLKLPGGKNARTATQDVVLPSVATKPAGSTEKVAPVVPLKSENVEVKKKISEVEGADNKNNKVPVNQDKKNKKTVNPPVQNGQNLRSPICCIMGHVDTGKTKLLDCIRGTNVQEGEAGGITQQIGATYFPAENIRERTKELKADAKLNVPGLLVIDTPGHESFTNLRSRGSGLCDIAILVVDIMHGLEPQTIESLNLLKMRNTEFIVALNKVDRLYGWKTCRNAPITKAMKQQSKDVQIEFNMRLTQVITQFKEQGLNTELYYKNKEMGETFSIVPTSAISGEGIPDLLLLLVQWTQKTMVKRLTYSDEVQCTVLEVKVIEGHGTTIDVVLVNGVLHEGDQIVVCGLQGPIVTTIRALLTPHPMKELRVKAAQGIKITAQGLEHAIAGTSLYVVGPHDDLEDITEAAMEDMKSVMSRIDKSGEGVYVQASTLGSLEALLEFLKSPAVSIPVSGISIGPVHKKDVMKASVMLEKKKEYGTILAFDVKVTPEARELADELGVKIFIADIIYHLFDQFKAYIDNLKEEKKKEAADEAVFPCVLKIIPNCVFNRRTPLSWELISSKALQRRSICKRSFSFRNGVGLVGEAKYVGSGAMLRYDDVLVVFLSEIQIGTPICVPQRDFIEIGRIASIENNHKPVDYAKKGQKVAIKIIGSNPEEQQKMFGRHFEIEDELVSKISRNSLDALKEHYADDLSVEEKRLLFKLKKLFKIP
ncbi:UNVERIFIED_CONTAM: Eukaryotic translation initiation factor 5B [Sesamum latifolium]|uniref:Eukaryotic translation initiation factor 5B n=1 Tax=Sesamum latifolium TaxID=2727402 RepID=A0AAW2VTL5_9LAMI